MRIKNFWYWCNLCEVRFPVSIATEYAGWPIHSKCKQNNVSEDDQRFIWLDKKLNKQEAEV